MYSVNQEGNDLAVTPGKTEYIFLHWVRAVAMFLVMWPHLTVNLKPDWLVLKWVRQTINIPFAIRTDFGAFGTSFFFIATGFLLLCGDANRKNSWWAAFFV